eukprot:scaffold6362_cov378-Prasinococcus_capsulatus_cf.AAC.13
MTLSMRSCAAATSPREVVTCHDASTKDKAQKCGACTHLLLHRGNLTEQFASRAFKPLLQFRHRLAITRGQSNRSANHVGFRIGHGLKRQLEPVQRVQSPPRVLPAGSLPGRRVLLCVRQ